MSRLQRGGVSLVLACAGLLAGCDPFTGPARAPARIEALPRALTVSEREVIARSNSFAFELLREVYQRASGPNVFLSPLSASMALGMTLNGAATATFDSLRATLGFEGLTQDQINRSYHDLADLLLKLDPKVELGIANSTWARQGEPFLPSFFDAVRTWFHADARELNFASPAALATINGWAAEQTHDRVPKVLDRIDPNHILFLLNAVYFKGQWTAQFDVAKTTSSPFRLTSGATVPVPTMHGKLRAAVVRRPGAILGELPYGGQAFVLTIVVPEEGRSLKDLVAGLNAETWAEWTAALPVGDYAQVEAVDVALPKLELKYEEKLNDALTAMGMGIAFRPGADFSRMTPGGGIWIDFVKQNTFLKLDEQGTEAAAVTVVAMIKSAAPPSLIVDRPFLLAIRERLSGTVLFLGAIGDPR